MPKYWGKNYFAHGSFPEVGQKQKTEKKRRRKKEEREKERLNNGNNNGQATHGARKPPGPKYGPTLVPGVLSSDIDPYRYNKAYLRRLILHSLDKLGPSY